MTSQLRAEILFSHKKLFNIITVNVQQIKVFLEILLIGQLISQVFSYKQALHKCFVRFRLQPWVGIPISSKSEKQKRKKKQAEVPHWSLLTRELTCTQSHLSSTLAAHTNSCELYDEDPTQLHSLFYSPWTRENQSLLILK